MINESDCSLCGMVFIEGNVEYIVKWKDKLMKFHIYCYKNSIRDGEVIPATIEKLEVECCQAFYARMELSISSPPLTLNHHGNEPKYIPLELEKPCMCLFCREPEDKVT